MRTVTAMDMRRRLGEILDAAAAGERITIERDGRPMAVLVMPEVAARIDESGEERIARGLAALDRLDAFRERMAREHPEEDERPSTTEWIRRDRDSRAHHISTVLEDAGLRVREEQG
jgi:prevent-host-death family protein